jgi:hypothetical protein
MSNQEILEQQEERVRLMNKKSNLIKLENTSSSKMESEPHTTMKEIRKA